MSRGKITVGFGSKEQHELEIEEYVQARFKDHRLFSVIKVEDGTFVVSVENPPSTGRSNQNMRLSKESLVGLASAIMMYFEIKGESITELLKESLNGDNIEYSYSNNIVDQLKYKAELDETN